MGVPQLFQWVAQRCGGAVRAARAGEALECDALYVDFNSVVHQSARPVVEASARAQAQAQAPAPDPAALDDAVIAASLDALDALLGRVRPARLLYVAVDGLPPRAKLHQQRGRRYMAAWRREAERGAGAGAARWDSNAVTPGTRFMARLSAALRGWAARAPPGLRVEVSPASEPGEGEQKIFCRLRAERAERAVVHGLDADLLLMAAASPARRAGLRVLREDDQGRAHVVDAARLARDLAARMDAQGQGQGRGAPVAEAEAHEAEDARVADFVALAALVGNDFVPALPGQTIRGGALDALVRLHAQARLELGLGPRERLSRGGPEALGGLHPALLARVLQGVAAEEGAQLARADKRYYERCAAAARVRPDRRELEAYPLHVPFPAGTVRPGEGAAWRQRYYHHLLGVDDAGGVRDACVAYVAGLAWSLRYLAAQRCCAGGWWYAPTHAPCALDLAHALCDPALVGAVGRELDAAAELPPEALREPAWQLLMVLPPASAGLLPPALRGVPAHPACEHMYPRSFRVSTYLRERLWECPPLLPPMDVAGLARAVAECEQVGASE